MIDLQQRIDVIHNYVISNSKHRDSGNSMLIMYGYQTDDFIDYVNDLLNKWYTHKTDNKYNDFITNGWYKVILPKRCRFDFTIFSNEFYTNMLTNISPQSAELIRMFKYDDKLFDKVVIKCVDYYLITHDVNVLSTLLTNNQSTILTILYVYNHLEHYLYRGYSIEILIRLTVLYFLISKHYGKQLFDKQTTNKLFRYLKMYTDKVNNIINYFNKQFPLYEPVSNVVLTPTQLTSALRHYENNCLYIDYVIEDVNMFITDCHVIAMLYYRFNINQSILKNIYNIYKRHDILWMTIVPTMYDNFVNKLDSETKRFVDYIYLYNEIIKLFNKNKYRLNGSVEEKLIKCFDEFTK